MPASAASKSVGLHEIQRKLRFYRKIARMALKTESYFSALERKFVTPRINGIFHGINEFKPP
jgi:hypothetical protein